MSNLPIESAGLACVRRLNPLKVIQSHSPVTKQDRRPSYRRKFSARLQSSQFKCGLPVIEPPTTTLSSGFTDCESESSDSDLIDTFLVTSSNEGGVKDFIDSFDSVAATNSNSGCNTASDIAFISTSEKLGVTYSDLSITASTSVSILK